MKKMFLASSFADVSKLFHDFINEDCSGKTVTFIPTASVVEKVNFYVAAAKKAFEKLGIVIDELDVSAATREEIAAKLESNDYIYVSGGNTFYLLQELKKTGADQLIIDQIRKGKIYIGESAGSMIISPNVEYAELMDSRKKAENLSDCQALGIVDFYPVPHQGSFPFKKTVEKILLKYGTVLELRPMTNKQAMTVCGDQVELVG